MFGWISTDPPRTASSIAQACSRPCANCIRRSAMAASHSSWSVGAGKGAVWENLRTPHRPESLFCASSVSRTSPSKASAKSLQGQENVSSASSSGSAPAGGRVEEPSLSPQAAQEKGRGELGLRSPAFGDQPSRAVSEDINKKQQRESAAGGPAPRMKLGYRVQQRSWMMAHKTATPHTPGSPQGAGPSLADVVRFVSGSCCKAAGQVDCAGSERLQDQARAVHAAPMTQHAP